MKKNLLIALVIFSTLNIYSQDNKGKLLISGDMNYMKTSSESGVTVNNSSVQGQYLGLGSSIGYFVTDRFIVGVGLDYNREKESRSNALNFNNSVQLGTTDIKSKAFLPNVYLGYYYPIIKNLYFNLTTKVSFGKVKFEYDFFYAYTSAVQDTTSYSRYIGGGHDNSEYDIFSMKVSPEVVYFISPEFGVCLGLGGIEYSLIDNNSGWMINFNPNYWRVGFKFKL